VNGTAGVTPVEALERALSPPSLTADILKKYCVPLIKLVTVAEVEVETPSLKSV
jgi:hypothetical protein